MERDHDCLEWLDHRENAWVEAHGCDYGPYEHCYAEWWQCVVCGEKFTAEELDLLWKPEEIKP